MEILLTEKAQKQFLALPHNLQKKTRKQFSYLLQDYRHPSLNAKKYHEASSELWQARIDKGYRFYFFVKNPHYIVVSIINHPK
jgi:mRNA-degrading endonuclease RelE of RelBE toxin-antitoxin system